MSNNHQYRCRLCLQMVSSKIDLFKDDFPKMIEILTSLKVTKTDIFPKDSCINCARDVKAALLTRKRIIKSYKVLCEEYNGKNSDMISVKEVCSGRPNIQLITCQVKTGKNVVGFPKEINKNIELEPKLEKYVTNNDNCNSEMREVKIEGSITQNQSSSIGRVFLQNALRSKNIDNVTVMQILKIKRRMMPMRNNGEIVRRIKRNYTNRELSCLECKLKFSRRTDYSLHMAKHQKTKCDICGKSIRSDNFKKHLTMHSSNPVVCQLCGATCKNSDSLRGHHFYYHKCSASQYVCDQCGRGFRQKYKFLLHKKKEHGGVRNFKCETCGKAFFTNLNLNTHVNMTHKKLRPHICEYCGKGFSGKYALKTHVRQHTNEAPFACEYCEEGFRQKVSLKAHLKSKHGIQENSNFFCAVCERGFATTYALKIHERLHLMKKCQHCSQSFADQIYLDNHIRECHSEVENLPEAAVDIKLPISTVNESCINYDGGIEEEPLFDHEIGAVVNIAL